MDSLLWLLPALPILGALGCGALHLFTLRARRTDPDAAGAAPLAPWLASGAMAGAFAIAVAGMVTLAGLEPGARRLVSAAWSWIPLGAEHVADIDVAMVLDPLSSVMALVITGVGLLIHIYSAGYMKGDPGYAKYFAYLNLFVAAMLVLVLSSNLLGLFVGWEGVGLCSYLLIGFWYEKGWPAEAGQKAFVVNRIGDACFLVGSFLVARLASSLDFATINAAMLDLSDGQQGELLLAALLLFGGCCGKSAQWPLFTWLPDAMAGPTPVSALIHAATMVTAGVYLVVRLNPLFASVPGALVVIGCVGALTALIGATSALFQRDIKKVLAYSTVSQLGYMFLGLGVGAWAAAIFHLVTHAFFKGLLFLGSGSVIHALHHEQDMYRMGGLKRHMPTTWITFLCGAAALSGLPLLSGFFSKDEILAATFAWGAGRWVLWLVGIGAAALTAFYTWRMVALTFHGEERFDPRAMHPHESPASMTIPLRVLAVLSLVGGLIGLPYVLGVPHLLHDWLEPVTRSGDLILFGNEGRAHLGKWTEIALLVLGATVALVFAHLGFRKYLGGTAFDDAQFERRPGLATFLRGAWNVDSTYTRAIVQPIKLLAFLVATAIDQLAIDGLVNGAGAVARGCATKLRAVADGSVKTYALWMGSGAALLAAFWLWS